MLNFDETVIYALFNSHLEKLRPLRLLIRVMMRHDMTNKKTKTKTYCHNDDNATERTH